MCLAWISEDLRAIGARPFGLLRCGSARTAWFVFVNVDLLASLADLRVWESCQVQLNLFVVVFVHAGLGDSNCALERFSLLRYF